MLWVYGLIAGSFCYSLILLFIRKYLKCSHRLNEFYCSVSFAWAWGTHDQLVDSLTNQGLDVPKTKPPKSIWFNSPIRNTAIAAIIYYQRQNQIPNYKICKSTPNCSNYGIGVLRRYNLFKAMLLIKRRIFRCGKEKGSLDIETSLFKTNRLSSN